jgi:hypothetical protein
MGRASTSGKHRFAPKCYIVVHAFVKHHVSVPRYNVMSHKSNIDKRITINHKGVNIQALAASEVLKTMVHWTGPLAHSIGSWALKIR